MLFLTASGHILVESRHPRLWQLIEALQADAVQASLHITRHPLNRLLPKKQSKPVKSMQRHLRGLCSKLSASDDRGDSDRMSLEQFLSAVGHRIRLH